MAWTTPKTWASGYIVLAADLNTHLRDNLNVTAPAVMTTAGDIIYASGANTPARLAKSTTSTQYLANTGTSNVPAWNEVALTTGVSGTLPVANGGTGATSLTDKAVLISQDSGTDTVGTVAMDASGELLIGGTSGPAVATITAGTNVTITNGDGTITLAASGQVTQSQEVQFTRTASAGSGTQAITGATFEPTGVIFFGMVNDAAFASWGWGDDALGESVMYSKGTTPVFTYSDNACILLENSTHKMLAVLTSLDSDGCTLTWTKTNNGVDVYAYVFFIR